MGNLAGVSKRDDWPAHYRGFRLQISPDRSIWWQLYNGTDRLQLDPVPEPLVDDFLQLKPTGGRIHVTETNQVLTRIDEGDRDFRDVYVGELEIEGELIPPEHPEFSIDIRPEGLEVGDLWPSVYDGSRYSFLDQRVWWKNGETKRRHMVDGEFDSDILQRLNRYKSKGGSFRITPWGDVITLVPMHPSPEQIREQFDSLPRVTQNIIKLRKDRGVDMLPIYVGTLDDPSISVSEPRSLTDQLSEEERESLSSWAENLGRTSSTSADSHKATSSSQTKTDDSEGIGEHDTPTASERDDADEQREPEEEELPDDEDLPDDDPLDWIRREVRNDTDDSDEDDR
jgi:hypothetical protein